MMLERLLPWQRNEMSHFDDILAEVKAHNLPTELIERAFALAKEVHSGQYRKSGEPFLLHPLSVAHILVAFGLDEQTIAAALLHDTIEDTSTSLVEIKDEFGGEVAEIVDGVTKLDRMSFESEAEAAAASMRKMMVAVAKDIRVLFIKLADRLHNMRTLGALSESRRKHIATETLRVYAPLANRLGMQDLASQLEDLAFAALHSKWYAEIDNMVETRSPEREIYLTQTASQVEEKLETEDIKAEVIMRPKHIWSVYKKMSAGRNFDDIYDLSGLRVIVENVSDCYAAMGHIHSMWQILPGRFKDHIAMPKFNLYQSLHTTVMGPAGYLIEIQIRTAEMDNRAERGVASHWAYKEVGDSNLAWLSRIMDWVEDTSSPAESDETQKTNLLAENCGILVEGQDDIWVRLAHCCKPNRTDEILGFVTRGKGVSVHTSHCENAAFLSRKNPNRFIQVEWDELKETDQLIIDTYVKDN